jgi:hypothetical protein
MLSAATAMSVNATRYCAHGKSRDPIGARTPTQNYVMRPGWLTRDITKGKLFSWIKKPACYIVRVLSYAGMEFRAGISLQYYHPIL